MNQSAPTSDRIWTVNDRGRQFGPHTEQEVAGLLAAGNISASALVWKTGSPTWIPVTAMFPAPRRAAMHSPAPIAPVAPLPYNTPPLPANSNRVAAGIVALLFGGLGIHKFILGFSTAGLIMLLVTILTCGWGGIIMGLIGLIEGIIYLTKSEQQFYQDYVMRKQQWF
jgi:TM2 domain-containing membrane protein YozV